MINKIAMKSVKVVKKKELLKVKHARLRVNKMRKFLDITEQKDR